VSSAPPAALAVADAGKPKDGGAALQSATKRVQEKSFSLELASPGCRATEECVLTIKLTAAADYHVNKEYPYKFVPTAAPGIMYLAKNDTNTFTRASGDFVEQGEKIGTMTVRFKVAAPGDARVAGKYKLSVCSADQCQIEEEMLDLTVAVK
jgi:hypothetical protein